MNSGDMKQKFVDAGIFEEYHDKFPRDYVNLTQSQMNILIDYCNSIVHQYGEGIGFFMYGPNGTGKTGALMEILKAAIRQGYSARCISLGNIVTAVSDGWYNLDDRLKFIANVREVDFLVIDEVAKEYRAKDQIVTIAFEDLLRYRSMRRMPTHFTSNKGPADISGKYGASIKSLLSGHSYIMNITGEDFRAKRGEEIKAHFDAIGGGNSEV